MGYETPVMRGAARLSAQNGPETPHGHLPAPFARTGPPPGVGSHDGCGICAAGRHRSCNGRPEQALESCCVNMRTGSGRRRRIQDIVQKPWTQLVNPWVRLRLISDDEVEAIHLAALDILAEAESRVHDVPKSRAHFHEVGALDALADIAGSCEASSSLKADRILSRPVSVGGGYVQSAHGLLPVPGPAALEILRAHNIPWMGGPVDDELLTPTGAALLAALVDEFVPRFPLIQAERVGYGAGKKDLATPNLLRALKARIVSPTRGAGMDHQKDRVVQLETNVDDVTGEVLGHLIEELMQAGALDVSVIPAVMKKGRSGNVIRAISSHEDMSKLAGIIVRETGSLGVRVFPSLHRFVAEREERTVDLNLEGLTYSVAIKISRMDGSLVNVKAEYEDCRRIAKEAGVPLRMVIKKAEELGWRAADK